MRVMARSQGMDQIIRFAQGGVGHKVTDGTGLSGKYDFVLTYEPDKPAVVGSAVTEALSGPSFASALTEQLGLKLESKKGMVDVLVVDGFNKAPADH